MVITATAIIIVDIVLNFVILSNYPKRKGCDNMGLKSYTLRLDEEEYEKLRHFLDGYGDPDLNISFILRRYIRDLNAALPNLQKSPLNLLNLLTFYGSGLKQLMRTAELENLLKGKNVLGDTAVLDRAQAELDSGEQSKKPKRK